MRLYWELIKNSFQASAAYKMDTFLHLFRSNIGLFIQVSIWSALIVNGVVMSNQGNITRQEMVTYTVISVIISILLSNEFIYEITHKVYSGEIAMDLIKPISMKAILFSQQIGSVFFNMVFEIIPLIIIGILFFGLKAPALPDFLLFSLAVINGMAISYLIYYIAGLYALWYEVSWHMDALLHTLNAFFSGAFIPLWFFPTVLSDISMYLPFRLMYYTPISIYLGKGTFIDSITAIGYQFLWIFILLILEKIVWNQGVKKLVVQGG